PAGARAGSTITLADTVYNVGTARAGTFSVGFYISTDETITTADTRIGTRVVGGLEAGGGSSSAVTAVQVPASLAEGKFYFIGAIVDFTKAVPESDELNNTWPGIAIFIGPLPDLAMTAVSAPSTAAPGSFISVTDTVVNIGDAEAGSFSVFFDL